MGVGIAVCEWMLALRHLPQPTLVARCRPDSHRVSGCSHNRLPSRRIVCSERFGSAACERIVAHEAIASFGWLSLVGNPPAV